MRPSCRGSCGSGTEPGVCLVGGSEKGGASGAPGLEASTGAGSVAGASTSAGVQEVGGGEAAAKREDRMEGTGKDRASKPGALLNLSGRARAWGDSQPTRAHGAKSGLLLRKGPGKWPTK